MANRRHDGKPLLQPPWPVIDQDDTDELGKELVNQLYLSNVVSLLGHASRRGDSRLSDRLYDELKHQLIGEGQ